MNYSDLDTSLKLSLELLKLPEIEAAEKFVFHLQDLCSKVTEPSWWDQVYRASTSILLNMAEGLGKSRGYLTANYGVARGSAFESYAALSIGPEAFRELLPELKNLIQLLETRMKDARHC